MIAAPKNWCPNPASTSCLRVRGHSMSPRSRTVTLSPSILRNTITRHWMAKSSLRGTRIAV